MWTRLRQRAEWLWAPALHILVVLLLYKEVWWGIDGRLRWFGWDCLEYFWPDLSFYAGSLRAGEWPLWNPYDDGGYAFYGDLHPGLYYPLTWLLVGLGALFGAVPAWVIQAKALAQLAIGGITMHAYLRSRRLHPAAAALGGVAWIVSVPMIVHKASALNWPLLWAPLVLLAMDRAIAGARVPGWWRRAAFLAAALWLAGSAGPPQGYFYLLLVAVPYGAMRMVQECMAHGLGGLRAGAWAHGRVLAVAALLTLGLLLLMYLPASQVLETSTRANRSADYPFTTALQVRAALAGLVAPRAGDVSVYCGVLVLALATVAVVFRPRGDGWAPVFFVTGAALAMSLTFGRESPLLPFLVEHVPVFELFREPNRYKCLASMLLAPAAAHGLHALLTADAGARRRAVLVVVGVVAVLVVTALVLRAGKAPPRNVLVRSGVGWWMTFVALGGGMVLLAGMVLARGRARPALAAASAGLVFFDAGSFGNWYVEVATEAPVDDQEDRRHLVGMDGVETEWRVWDEFVMAQRPGSRLRIRNLRGYPSGAPFGDQRYETMRRHLGKHPELLEAFNVRWVLIGPHHRNGTHKNNVKKLPSRTAPAHFRPIDGKRDEALHPVPMVAWYGAVELVDTPARALDALRLSEDADGRRRVAIVERPDIPRALDDVLGRLAAVRDARPLVAGEVVSFAANRVSVRIDAPAEGVLVVNEKMFPGWRVTIDGRDAVGFRANYLLRAVVVEPGRHTITWTFAPRGVRPLRWLFVACLVFLLVCASWGRIRGLGR